MLEGELVAWSDNWPYFEGGSEEAPADFRIEVVEVILARLGGFNHFLNVFQVCF